MTLSAVLRAGRAVEAVAAYRPSRVLTGPIDTWGARVRHYRRLRGMTQEELADSASIDRRYIGRIETGEVMNPEPDTVKRLARALTVPVRALAAPLGWWDDEGPNDWEAALRTEMERKGYGPEDAEAVVRSVRLALGEREQASA